MGRRPARGSSVDAPPGDSVGFATRLELLLGQIAAMDGARLPGSRRLAALEMAEKNGLSIPVTYLNDARVLAGA